MNRTRIALATAVAPCLWGTTYLVFDLAGLTGHPVGVGAARSIPAGLLLLALTGGTRPGSWRKLLTLALLNISLFTALLLTSAARLPGGVAATLTATQPVWATLLAWPLLGEVPTRARMTAAGLGVFGVALLTLGGLGPMDPVGIGAALGAAATVALSAVLLHRWVGLGSPLTVAGWQLVVGGLALVPVALWLEGPPPSLGLPQGLGLAWLAIPGTALPYWLWTRGIARLGASVTFLGLLTPLVATILGAAILGERLSPIQLTGVLLVLSAAVAGLGGAQALWARLGATLRRVVAISPWPAAARAKNAR